MHESFDLKILLANSPAGAAGAAGPREYHFRCLFLPAKLAKTSNEKIFSWRAKALQTSHLGVCQQNDLNIRRLVAAINAFEGLTVIGGCAGHPDPRPDQWPEGVWYVMFTVQRTDEGWFALEFLAWAINNDYQRGGHQVLLSPIAPPPYLNEPGQSLQFVIEGSAGANATVLATWLNQLHAKCYVAP